MTFHELFPVLKPWVDHLPNGWPGRVIKPQFAFWEVLHIVSIILLGGSSILVNLRLLGVGLTEEPASEIQRYMRKFLVSGVALVVASGLLIGSANAGRLYDSNAFTVKIICLIAGIILTFGASLPAARANGTVSSSARAWGLGGLAVWTLGIWIFATSEIIAPGLYHTLSAAALVLLIMTLGRVRLVYLAGLLTVIVAQQLVMHLSMNPDDVAEINQIHNIFIGLYTLWIGGFAIYRIMKPQRETEAPSLAKLIALATILVWVTAAAAGRWIAFA